MKYRKRPTIIDAVQWNGIPEADGTPETDALIVDLKDTLERITGDLSVYYPTSGNTLRVQTPTGTFYVEPGQYLCRGPEGEPYVRTQAEFEATYERVNERAARHNKPASE